MAFNSRKRALVLSILTLNYAMLSQYIYISLEEMGVVARYITSRGRIAISELAAKSNTFIDLELKASSQEAGGVAATIEF